MTYWLVRGDEELCYSSREEAHQVMVEDLMWYVRDMNHPLKEGVDYGYSDNAAWFLDTSPWEIVKEY